MRVEERVEERVCAACVGVGCIVRGMDWTLTWGFVAPMMQLVGHDCSLDGHIEDYTLLGS